MESDLENRLRATLQQTAFPVVPLSMQEHVEPMFEDNAFLRELATKNTLNSREKANFVRTCKDSEEHAREIFFLSSPALPDLLAYDLIALMRETAACMEAVFQKHGRLIFNLEERIEDMRERSHDVMVYTFRP